MNYKNERALNYNSPSFLARYFVLEPHLPKNTSVLEVACGNGLISKKIIDRGNKLTAIDYNEKSIEHSNNLKGNFVISSFEDFETTEKYDYIIATEIIEHLKDDEKALKKMRNLLEKDGRIIISVPISKFQEKYRRNVGHLRHYKTKDLINMAKKVGLEPVYIKEWGSFIRTFILSNLQGTSFNKTPTKIPNIICKIMALIIKLDAKICPLKKELLIILKKL